MTLSIFDHKKNKKSSQANNGQSKLGNTIYEIAKEFSPILSTNAKPKSQEEIAKEFLPTNGQASRMSNAFASLKSQPKSKKRLRKSSFLQTVKQVECQMHLLQGNHNRRAKKRS